jgi:urea transporter
LPTAFEPAVKAMVTDSITGINNKAATLPFVVTTWGIETDPTAWGFFPFTG